MKNLRFSTSSLMALVLVVALDFGMCKALLPGGQCFVPDLSDLIVFGALPMVNVLALGLIPRSKSRHQRAARRLGLIGFEVSGLIGLIFYLGCSILDTQPIHRGVGAILRGVGFPPGPVFLVGAVVLLLVPQVVLAFLGGWLARSYRLRVNIVVERRVLPTEPESVPESQPEPRARASAN